MTPTSPTPAFRATLKERVERDRLAEAAESPGSESKRFFALLSAAKAKTARGR